MNAAHEPSPGTLLLQTPHRTPPSLARITETQRKRPDHLSDDLVQPFPRDNWMGEH